MNNKHSVTTLITMHGLINFYENFLQGFIIFFNPVIHNVEKWSNILLKYCGFRTARFLRYVRRFFKIMNERVEAVQNGARRSNIFIVNFDQGSY